MISWNTCSRYKTMSAYKIQKVSRDGIGYSIAELNDVRHVFAAAVPQSGTTFREQAESAMEVIREVNSFQGTANEIVNQAVFLADRSLLEECRRFMREFYGPSLPAISYILQPSCEGKLLAVESLGMGGKEQDLTVSRINEHVVMVRHNGIAWVHAAIAPETRCIRTAYEQASHGFSLLRSVLADAGIRMDRILRTWLYQGGIVADEGDSQRYKELNRARTDAYQDVDFLAGLLPRGYSSDRAYPASTGIGTDGSGFAISAIALSTERSDIRTVPLENPVQTPAFKYPGHYSPNSPQFSRAMAVSCGNMATIFISGTASVTASEARHIGDAEAQTRQTLDNIAALIGEENLSRHGLPGLGTTLDGLGYVRVYIKRQEDFARIRAVCQERLGELPAIYAIADVCRPEWLVEIEGIAISRKEAAPKPTVTDFKNQ